MFHVECLRNFVDFFLMILIFSCLCSFKYNERHFWGRNVFFQWNSKFQGIHSSRRIEKLFYTVINYFSVQYNFHLLLLNILLLFQIPLVGVHFFHWGKEYYSLCRCYCRIFEAYTLSKAYKSFCACFDYLIFYRLKMD